MLTIETALVSNSEHVPRFPVVKTEGFSFSKTIKTTLKISDYAQDRPQTCFHFKNINLHLEPVTSEKEELSQR